ncbi:DUF2971 domain-containing protein [Pelagibius marinus]|uniref:DUF2971 domain-containing protein n=1 Tax=Pelagibius marinus TaxID=2762760 RepID=UPI00187282BD|nr:DUF2971 domain-containing protein [Pelagibius marinus]
MSDVWYMLQDLDRYVYHYTSAATLTDHILPTRKLRFSRFRYVNDPRESKDWRFNYHYLRRVASSYDFDAVGSTLNKRLKNQWRIGCFVSDVERSLATKERMDSGIDVLSPLHERGHSRPRMWAQYGENYRGACLVFDKKKLDHQIRSTASAPSLMVYSAPVKYRNPKMPAFKPGALTISIDELESLGLDEFIKAHVKLYWKDLFFVKSEDWEQEREFRWLIEGEGDEDFFVEITDCMVGILIGDRFPEGRKPAVGKHALEIGVSIAIMDWQNGIPQPGPSHPRLLT